MFESLEGVPHTIRFGNLAPAVKKVLPNGERELTEEFERFVAHDGFSYEFCNPGSGNEKGHVESMVKYIRNNYLLPTIPYDSLAALNEQTLIWSVEDRNRPHYEKELLIAELYLVDKNHFLQLPGKAYECVRFDFLVNTSIRRLLFLILATEIPTFLTHPAFNSPSMKIHWINWHSVAIKTLNALQS